MQKNIYTQHAIIYHTPATSTQKALDTNFKTTIASTTNKSKSKNKVHMEYWKFCCLYYYYLITHIFNWQSGILHMRKSVCIMSQQTSYSLS